MDTFSYLAEAVDGKKDPQRGAVIATNKKDAEQQVKAKFTYPVNVTVTLWEVLPDSSGEDSTHDHGDIDAQLERANVYHSTPNPKK